MGSRTSTRSLLASVACALAAAGCGGATFTNIDGDAGQAADSSADGGSTADGGSAADGGSTADGGGNAVCPASAPTGTTPCAPNGAQCEYGTDPNPSCNAVIICANGSWTFPPRGACSPTGASCPASYAGVPQNKQCSPEFLNCAYPEGTCECSRQGGIVRQEPVWFCEPATAECPSPRPRIGSSCKKAGQFCDYGSCNNGAAIECKDAIWQVTHTPCPL